MPDYEFFCHTCNRPFSKALTPTEYKEGNVVCPNWWSRDGFIPSRLSRAPKKSGALRRPLWCMSETPPEAQPLHQRLAARRSPCQQKS
jgi:hypothetical protein